MDVGSSLDLTIPIAWEPEVVLKKEYSRLYGAGAWWLRIMGRLKPGATVEQARAQLENVFRQSVIEHRAARQAQARTTGGIVIDELDPKFIPHLFLDPGGRGEMSARKAFAPSLHLMQGIVGLVLLIAC